MVNESAILHNLLKLVTEQQARIDQLEAMLAGLGGALCRRDYRLFKEIAEMRETWHEVRSPEDLQRADQWTCYLHDAIRDLERGRELPLS